MRLAFGRFSWICLAIIGGLGVGYYFKENDAGNVREVAPNEVKEVRKAAPRLLGGNVLSTQLRQESQKQLQELEDLAFRDHDAALLKLAALGDPDLKSFALAAIARGWAKTDPEAAGAWVAKLESEDDAISAALGLVPTWAELNANNCLLWATTLAQGNLREISMAQLADAWVAINPQEAATHYFGLSSEPGSESGLHVIVSQWAVSSPQAAVNYLTGSSNLPRREEFLETAIVSLSNEDPALAWSYTKRFQDVERMHKVQCVTLEAMAESKPLDAIKLAESAGNDSEFLKSVARGWASNDPEGAKAWIQTVKDEAVAKSLLDEISPE